MLRTIVADDEPEFRHWLRSLLDNTQEFQIVGEAGSGEEALDMVESLLPDLVLVDVYMPDRDGIDVTHHIRSHFPDTDVILISAYDGRIYERLATEESALAFISKANLSLETLSQALRKGKQP